MSELRDIVRQYAPAPALLGAPSKSAFDRKALERELGRLRRAREIWFWLCAAAMVALFALAVAFIISRREDTAAITKMSTATGITLTGVVALMTKLWQDRVRADLILAMASGMSEEALREALLKLIERL